MTRLLILSPTATEVSQVLPALELLPYELIVLPASAESLVKCDDYEAVVLDARTELLAARNLAGVLHSSVAVPLLLVLEEGGLSVLSDQWMFTDFVLASAGPAEIQARVNRLQVRAEPQAAQQGQGDEPEHNVLVIDELSYTAKIEGRVLDLTYKEFELLKYLAQHPGRVFSRDQLLHEVWGYDYYGGTRTVDVHVRRLRAKLGTDHEQLIGTVRNVGYRYYYDDAES
ncbi:response regulator transcription factor [Glutamicibacter sp. PS]|uniref:winged helix-turn-helix domain-containing protein n=1 Tax=Glutamicibacter TaxID=1742989 RepID=UPI00283CD23E|nr:response regulator transcription factor [Glutamicibacter sp. PS]MDR4532178.1 response regulator transcription factor [Glutamicibacter sp. PS]